MSIIELLVSLVILSVTVTTAGYQLLASQEVRKAQYERAAAAGLADSAMLQTLLAFRDKTRAAAEKNPLAVRSELIKMLVELTKNPPTAEMGGKIVTAMTNVPAPPQSLHDAGQFQETVKRCRGLKPGRPASPHFSDSALYFCITMTPVGPPKSSLWQGVDSRFPALVEAHIRPVEASTGRALRFDDIARERSAAILRILYSVVWVQDKGSAKSPGSAQSVRWLAKEIHAPVF